MDRNYYGGFNNNCQQYYPQYQQQQVQQRYVPQPNSNIEYVNGVDSVRAMYLPPNHIRFYLDSDTKCFYIKRTDLEGRATIEIHPYTDVDATPKPAQYVTVDQFEALKKEIEQLKSNTEVKSNEQL